MCVVCVRVFFYTSKLLLLLLMLLPVSCTELQQVLRRAFVFVRCSAEARSALLLLLLLPVRLAHFVCFKIRRISLEVLFYLSPPLSARNPVLHGKGGWRVFNISFPSRCRYK